MVPPPSIRRVAVIGAGTMGAAIAAQCVNAGVPTLLLDIPADGDDRNAIVQAGLERALRARPPAFMDPEGAPALLTLGNTADDFAKLADVDWIVEAIIEKPGAKQALWARVETAAGPQTIFSSNSSGIPMHVQSEGRSADFKRRFLGAHFYNPPRYLYLLELIPTEHTAPEALESVRAFGERMLGKGIVIANDVPGFIGNRLGIYALLQAARTMEEMNLSPEVVDALTGPVMGRPKSATLRTCDAVGLDVLALISEDLTRATGEDYRIPAVMQRLLARGDRGEKSGRGYYQRRRNADGSSTILALNPQTLEYEERAADLPELVEIRRLTSVVERTRALLALDSPAGEFTRRTLPALLRFAAEKEGVVAKTRQEIDRAMQWGFGWELGPFALADALEGKPAENPPHLLIRRERAVRTGPDASLIDLGGGALLLEFHNKANSVSKQTYAMAAAALEIVPGGFAGLVIGNEGRWFSAGADLAALLADARSGNAAAVQAMIEGFQTMTTSLRAAPFPVVCAPFGMTLGGGCETMLYSDAVQAGAELTTGLVELRVGLMPSAGGTTEMFCRSLDALPAGADPLLAAEATFNLIMSSVTSQSALHALRLGFLRATDGITMNKRRLLADAKDVMLALAAGGYQPPEPRRVPILGAPALARLAEDAAHRREAGEISGYDVHLAGELARILTGGGAAPEEDAPVQRLLDLEREVFVGLCQRPETHARIEHMLKTGRPLRN